MLRRRRDGVVPRKRLSDYELLICKYYGVNPTTLLDRRGTYGFLDLPLAKYLKLEFGVETEETEEEDSSNGGPDENAPEMSDVKYIVCANQQSDANDVSSDSKSIIPKVLHVPSSILRTVVLLPNGSASFVPTNGTFGTENIVSSQGLEDVVADDDPLTLDYENMETEKVQIQDGAFVGKMGDCCNHCPHYDSLVRSHSLLLRQMKKFRQSQELLLQRSAVIMGNFSDMANAGPKIPKKNKKKIVKFVPKIVESVPKKSDVPEEWGS